MPMVVTRPACSLRFRRSLEQAVQRGGEFVNRHRAGVVAAVLMLGGHGRAELGQRRRTGTRLRGQRLLVVARSDPFDGDDVRERPARPVFEEGVNPALGRCLAVDGDAGGGANGNRKRVAAGSRHGRPQGRRAQSVGHERDGDADGFERQGQQNRTGRTVGFGGRWVGGGDEKAGDDGGMPARFGQRLGGVCQVARTEGAVEGLTRNQAAGGRIPADDSIDSVEHRRRQ